MGTWELETGKASASRQPSTLKLSGVFPWGFVFTGETQACLGVREISSPYRPIWSVMRFRELVTRVRKKVMGNVEGT